jgi:hypothetical protein
MAPSRFAVRPTKRLPRTDRTLDWRGRADQKQRVDHRGAWHVGDRAWAVQVAERNTQFWHFAGPSFPSRCGQSQSVRDYTIGLVLGWVNQGTDGCLNFVSWSHLIHRSERLYKSLISGPIIHLGQDCPVEHPLFEWDS